MSATVVRWRGERARVGVWRGDDRAATVNPVPDTPPLSGQFVDRVLAELRERGFCSAVTGALTPAESLGFLDAGFRVREELHLLEHPMVELPAPAPGPRRARRADRPAVLDLDARSFDDFWHLDDAGLDEAVRATPSSRFRVVGGPGHSVAGYAVSGRAGVRGYLQRLAVDPSTRRQGIGRALVADALAWMGARGVRRALVNTHVGNEAALCLYRSCGFELLPTPLRVLSRDL